MWGEAERVLLKVTPLTNGEIACLTRCARRVGHAGLDDESTV